MERERRRKIPGRVPAEAIRRTEFLLWKRKSRDLVTRFSFRYVPGFFALFCFDYTNVRAEFVHQQED